MQTGYDLSKQAGTSVDEIAIAATQASDEALLDVFGLARAEQASTSTAAQQMQVAEVVNVLQREIERRGLGVPVVAATKTAADDFSGGGMLHALWIKFKEWLLMHNGYADYADEYAFASLKPRKEGTVNEQTFAQREAALLQAMASAPTLERQRELAHDLVALRHERTASIQADRDLDLANAVVRDTMTPVVVASHHTIATDWMGEDTAVEGDEITRTMAAAASRFYIGTSDDVRADAEEFEIQAAGMAQAVAGQYGEQAPVAVDAFVRHALFLNRSPEAQGRTASLGTNPNVTPLVTKAASAIVDGKYPVPCVVVRPGKIGYDAVAILSESYMEDVAKNESLDAAIKAATSWASSRALPVVGPDGEFLMNPSALASRRTALVRMAMPESIYDFPEGTTAICVQCGEPILLDQREGGGPGKDWGARPEDWVGNGGIGMDYGCDASPLNDEEGTGGHSPKAGTIKPPASTASLHLAVTLTDGNIDSEAERVAEEAREQVWGNILDLPGDEIEEIVDGIVERRYSGDPRAKEVADQAVNIVISGSKRTAADADVTPYPAHEQAGYAETGLPVKVPTEGYEEKGVVGDYGQEVAPENVDAVKQEGEHTPMPGAGESVPGVTAAAKCSNCANGNHTGTNGTPGCKGGSCSCSCRKNASLRAQASGPVKGIAIYPDKRVEDVTINGLSDGQAIVGGLIQPVTLKDGSTMYVNEEFLYSFGPDDVNWIASDVAGLGGRPEFMLRSPILGPVYIVGPIDGEGYDTDITDTARNWVTRVKREASIKPFASALDAGMRSPAQGFATSILAQGAREDYEHHNEDADRIWWEEEGRHGGDSGTYYCDVCGYDHAGPCPMDFEASKKTAADGPRPIYEIASEIRSDWKNVYFGAVPYLDAMGGLDSINDRYGADDARMILNYFLSNASGWRGETAKRVKAEIKGLLGRKAAKEAVVWDDVDDDEYEDGQTVTVTEALPYGMFDTIIRFKGTTEDGKEITFAADHRMARPILEELANGEHPQAHVPGFMSLGSIQTKAVLLTNVSFDGGIGNNVAKGTDPSGKVVRFRLSDEDAKSLSSVLTGDLAGNFSGVTVDEGDIITEAAKTAGTDPDDQNGGAESNLPTPEKDTTTAWPWELPTEPGSDAADVAAVPTPGGESGYPQPKKAAVDNPDGYLHAFRTFLGMPAVKGEDEPVCGAKITDAYESGGSDRPKCPDCQKIMGSEGKQAALVADPKRLAAFSAAVTTK